MQHVGQITAELIKQKLPPEKFYPMFLNGAFGKHTGKGWHTWNGLCPFHDDKRAGSLVVNRLNGAFKCFSCGTAGGDIIDFYIEKERLGFKEAFKQLGRVATCEK